MFYTNTRSGECAQIIYDTFYKTGYCKDTWFYFNGKPLIIAIENECSEEVRDFFTIKQSQWPNEATKLGGWPWMDFERPQRVFNNENNIPEVINVSVAQHPQCRFGDNVLYGETANRGRSFHNDANDPTPGAFVNGFNFQEQFDRALETDPPVVLVTGWNEWIAGRWPGPEDRPIMFVDCINDEYSRDIEMMRGGYFDNYYMQLIANVRRYKGTCGVPSATAGSTTTYRGFADGDFTRDSEGWSSDFIYKNDSSRNSITSVNVSHDEKNIVFDINVKNAIENDVSGSFFNVFISSPESSGFDYVANVNPNVSAKTAEICKINANGDALTSLTPVGNNTFEISDRKIKISVPLEIIGDKSEILFKVGDSREAFSSVEDFYDKGDVLPMGRPSFLYRK